MKNSFAIFFFFWLGFNSIQSQDLHTPSQIETIMKKSLFYYEQVEDTTLSIAQELNVLEPDYYFHTDENNQVHLLNYTLDSFPKQRELFNRVVRYHVQKKYAKEQKTLLKLIELDNTNAVYLTAMGETYYEQKEYSQATSWVKKAIRANPIHSPAHVLLAKIYMIAGQNEQAMKAITLAHIYNRNNRKTIQLLKDIYKANGRIYDETWAFIPQFQVTQISKNKINIKYNGEPWRAYGACSAVWDYEPYYKSKMEITGNDTTVLRQHEMLMNLAIAYDGWENKKRKNKFYMGNAVKMAVEKKLIQEFIDYEMKFIANPEMTFYLTSDEIEDISRYIIEVRALKISYKGEIIEDQSKLIDGN